MRILKFGGNGPSVMSDGILLLHKPSVTASGSHLGYAGLLWVGQKYLAATKTRLTALTVCGHWAQGGARKRAMLRVAAVLIGRLRKYRNSPRSGTGRVRG